MDAHILKFINRLQKDHNNLNLISRIFIYFVIYVYVINLYNWLQS